MSLISTVYVSSANKPFTQAELIELLRISRENNTKAGLTGMLLYHDGNFMQLLEGEPESVDALLNKLSLDPRHSGLMVLVRKPIEARSFGEWQMAFRNTGELPPTEMAEVSTFLQPSFAEGTNGQQSTAAMKLLNVFRAKLR